MNELHSNGNSLGLRALWPTALQARASRFGVVAVGALVFAFSWPTLASLPPYWLGYNYSHSYLVLALTALLVVLEMRRGGFVPLAPSWVGFACLAAAASAIVLGHASTTLLGAHVALPLLWVAAVWAGAGATNARRFALPLGYVYFAMPVWDPLVQPLQSLTVAVVTAWIRAAGLPAFIDGTLIHLPSGSFEVEGGCAGLNYVIVALALAAFAGLVHQRRWLPSGLLAMVGLVLALAANWLRVYVIVVVGHFSEMKHMLVTYDHRFFGWILFVVVCMTPLLYLNRKLYAGGQEATPAIDTGPEAEPVSRQSGVVYASCAVLALGTWITYSVNQGETPLAGGVALALPEVPGWEKLAEWQDSRRPEFRGATAEAASWYVGNGKRVGAYVAYYAVQRQEQEVVSSQNRAEGSSGEVVARRAASVTAANGTVVPFRELEIVESDAERRLVWYTLRVAGRPAADDLAAKLYQVAGAVRGRRDAQALVLMTTCARDCLDARESLSRYAKVAPESLYEGVGRALVVPRGGHSEEAKL